jgi:hypothetical protein
MMKTFFMSVLTLAVISVPPAMANDADAQVAIRAMPGVVDVLNQSDSPVQWTVDTLPEQYSVAHLKSACSILERNGLGGNSVRFVNAYMVHVGKTFREASLGHIDCKSGETFMP